MRRRLACDWHKVERPPEATEERLAGIEEAVDLWSRGGGRIVMLDSAAMAALEEVPIAASLGALRPLHPQYVASETAGGFNIPDFDVDGFYCATAGIGDGPPVFTTDAVQIEGVKYSPTIHGVCSGDSQNVGPSFLITAKETGDAATDRLHRLLVATLAAVANPLWVRSVLPGWEAGEHTPSSPRRARKRGDPRAKPYQTVRLSPDARHIVRHKEPVRCGQQPPRRIGRGIVLGTPRVTAEHDVRKHTRRIVTTEERAMERDDWTPVELLPESMVAVLVPVRPHVRGKGPRRALVVRGPK